VKDGIQMKVVFTAPGMAVSGGLASFHWADIGLLLQLGHDVRTHIGHAPTLSLLRDCRWADVAFSWTSAASSVAAAYSARRSVVCVGGYEFCALPELGYGGLLTRRGRWLSRAILRKADAVLAVDPLLRDEALRFCPEHAGEGKVRVVPTGYDTDFWSPDGRARGNGVVTVGSPLGTSARLKGIDVFLRAARADDSGAWIWSVAGGLDVPGVERFLCLGRMSPLGLRELFRTSRVYCQLSRREALPNALCEAMLCGCVPVGTRVGGIPRAMGSAGVLLDDGYDTGDLQAAVAKAAWMSPEVGRRHVATNFPAWKRRGDIRGVLEELA